MGCMEYGYLPYSDFVPQLTPLAVGIHADAASARSASAPVLSVPVARALSVRSIRSIHSAVDSAERARSSALGQEKRSCLSRLCSVLCWFSRLQKRRPSLGPDRGPGHAQCVRSPLYSDALVRDFNEAIDSLALV